MRQLSRENYERKDRGLTRVDSEDEVGGMIYRKRKKNIGSFIPLPPTTCETDLRLSS
jgi:hypothetical protein